MQLSRGYDLHHRIGLLSEPILTEFRHRIGWPSDVALFDHDAMIVVQTSRETGPLFFNRRPGFRAPILETSIGRAYLAYCDPAERERIITRLRAKPDIRKIASVKVVENRLALRWSLVRRLWVET